MTYIGFQKHVTSYNLQSHPGRALTLDGDNDEIFVQIEEDILDDPFKLNSGGLVTGKDMKGYKTKTDAYDVGTQFYKETHIRLLTTYLSLLLSTLKLVG